LLQSTDSTSGIIFSEANSVVITLPEHPIDGVRLCDQLLAYPR